MRQPATRIRQPETGAGKFHNKHNNFNFPLAKSAGPSYHDHIFFSEEVSRLAVI